MTTEEKLQAIKDMGIDIWDECPYDDYGIKDYCQGNGCEECWIKALEG